MLDQPISGVWVVLALVGTVGGIVTGFFARKIWARQQINSAEAKLQGLVNETKNKQKEILLEAKERASKVIDEAKREESQRRREIDQIQQRMERREATFDQKLLELEDRKAKLEEKSGQLDTMKAELLALRKQQIEKLEQIAGLSQEDAKKVLMENTERDMKEELLARVRKLQKEGQDTIDREAKEMLSTAMQRFASTHAVETTTTVLPLPSDDMKGRIIGREGRNIKAIEQATGVEIIVDDTPEAIVISGFNPIRRHVAKRALENLLKDGRIHPGRIEEAVEQAKKDLAKDIKEAGEEAAYEVGVAGLDPKLLQVLGRLKYRTSYGQNQLRHAVEVAILSGIVAEEIGANVAVAKKGGLLHDIGKALDHEVQGGHPEIGYDIMKKFGLPEEVAYCAIGHHEDQPKTLEAVVVKVADAISGARPGARKDTYEQYVQRLDELEGVAKSFDGVEKAYAIQAGREVRVFVVPDKVDDLGATKLAKDIAGKIEQELKYPGEIKVNVIREKRIIEYAR